MFEQSILLPEQDKKRWTFAASILVEVSAVSVLVLIPLIYTERLGLGWIQSVIPTAPFTRQQPPVLDSHVTRTSRAPRPNEFLMPNLNAHPRREILIDDQASLQPCPSCVESSLPPSDMTISRVGFDGSNRVLPPPPPSMLSFFASSWMRMLIQLGAGAGEEGGGGGLAAGDLGDDALGLFFVKA